MESDQHYFFEGLFIIVFSVAGHFSPCGWAAPATMTTWSTASILRLGKRPHGRRPGEIRGVDAGTVKAIVIDPTIRAWCAWM